MGTPSIAHILYISCALAIGFYVGWSLGTKAVRNEWARAERRRRDEEEAATEAGHASS